MGMKKELCIACGWIMLILAVFILLIYLLFHFLYWWLAMILIIISISKTINYTVMCIVFRGSSIFHLKDLEYRINVIQCNSIIKA